MSVSDSMRSNGDRHMANARRHATAGNKEYAFGSFKKAKRNYAKADATDRFFYVPVELRPVYDAFFQAINKNLYCTSSAAGGLNALLGDAHG